MHFDAFKIRQFRLNIIATVFFLVYLFLLLAGVGCKSEMTGSEENPGEMQQTNVNWKTYQNDQYGFEFQHPSSYETKRVSIEGTKVETQIALLNASRDKTKTYPFFLFSLPGDTSLDSINPNAKNLTDYENDYTNYVISNSGRRIVIESSERKSIKNIIALRQTYSVVPKEKHDDFGMESGSTERYVFYNEGKFIILVLWDCGWEDGCKKDEDPLLLDKIAQTVKFNR